MQKQVYLFLLMIACTYLNGQSVDSKQKNVLYVIADDLSSIINSYNDGGVITPNLDKLAANGVVFEKAYCQSSLCNPSRTSIMTGKYPAETRVLGNQPHFRGVDPSVKTIPQYFKEQGYYSVGIGKIYHNWGQAIKGDERSWSEPEIYHWGAHFMDWYIPGRPYELHTDIKKRGAVQCEDVPDEAYLDGRVANAAVNKLRELREVPFFMAVGFWKPHLPYNAPKKYWDLYDRENLPGVKYDSPVNNLPEWVYVNSNEARSYTDVHRLDDISEEKKAELRHGYLASISYMDAQFGKIYQELERLDLLNSTIIVFVSDHGYHAGEHGQFGKWTNFEIGAKVPLILSSPGLIEKGARVDEVVELIDLFPSLIDLCDVEKTNYFKKLSGTSFKSILLDKKTTVKNTAVTQIQRPIGSEESFKVLGSSIRSDNFRYNIWTDRYTNTIIAEELYDLSMDVMKVENVAHLAKYQAIKREHLKLLNDKLNSNFKE